MVTFTGYTTPMKQVTMFHTTLHGDTRKEILVLRNNTNVCTVPAEETNAYMYPRK